MNWTSIIQDLMASGLSQSEIAAKCQTGQSHISGLFAGERKQPGWQLGQSLIVCMRNAPSASRPHDHQTHPPWSPPFRRSARRCGTGLLCRGAFMNVSSSALGELAFAGPAGWRFFVVARQMVRAGFAGIDGDER